MYPRQTGQLASPHQEAINEVTDLAVTMEGVIFTALTKLLKVEVV